MSEPAVTARTDVAGRADIMNLLRTFYGRVLVDELLAEPFTEVRERGLESHLPVMCDFWSTVLFGTRDYRGSAMTVHRAVHDRHPVGTAHFVRWLTLWVATVERLFDGPRADRAVVQATRIAWAMHRHLTGGDDAGLDTLIADLRHRHR